MSKWLRLLTCLLVVAIACAPSLGRDNSFARWTASQQPQDPWEQDKPGEVDKDTFENEIALDPFDLICPTLTPTAACLFSDGVTTAHFLEASLYVLRHLRI